jgi:heterodisulfide reductase subunit A-like polyferredoxin
MTASLALAEQGFQVHLVEKEAELGGNLRKVFIPSNGKEPQVILSNLVKQVGENSAITLHMESNVVVSSGFVGNFTSTIQNAAGKRMDLTHGVTILATGAQEYRGPEYGYGTDPRLITQQEFETLLAKPKSTINKLKSVAMIQCVGPAEKFCSRICCTVAIKNAMRLKELNPKAEIVIFYNDIRTYGFKERLYTEARRAGVKFVHFEFNHKPEVVIGNAKYKPRAKLRIKAWEPRLGRHLELEPDLLVLSMPIVPPPNVHELAKLFKVPIDADGFFLEAHVKLRPVDFASDGIFMAGMAHYPKLLDETMIQARAAAARAARVLSRETLTAGGRVAVVDALQCTGCLTCVRVCPFGVPKIHAEFTGVGGILGAAYIESAVCQGCGSCAAECPARAIQLMHYTDTQLTAKVEALFEG